jgi:hypothetical protein
MLRLFLGRLRTFDHDRLDRLFWQEVVIDIGRRDDDR